MKCGECTACCYAFQVDEVDKGPCQECKYNDNGCTIYETRPQTCKDYECAWLGQPDAPEELRPDKCGVIFTKMPGNVILASVLDKVTHLIYLQVMDFIKQGYKVKNDSTELYRRFN